MIFLCIIAFGMSVYTLSRENIFFYGVTAILTLGLAFASVWVHYIDQKYERKTEKAKPEKNYLNEHMY